MVRRGNRRRLARAGAAIALGLAGILVIWVTAIGNPFALAVLAPAVAGGLVGLRWSERRTAAIAAATLISMTIAVSLIGYWGLFFVPSVMLLVMSALRPGPTPAAG
jgi:hypothetical protein